jgi:hypothetical protein
MMFSTDDQTQFTPDSHSLLSLIDNAFSHKSRGGGGSERRGREENPEELIEYDCCLCVTVSSRVQCVMAQNFRNVAMRLARVISGNVVRTHPYAHPPKQYEVKEIDAMGNINADLCPQ